MSFVRLRIKGLNAEKLINAARNKGIPLSSVRREQNRELSVRLPARHEKAFREIAEEKGFWAGESVPEGMLRLKKGILKRWSLPLGAFLACGLIIGLLGRVWVIRVENAGPYEGEVKAVLQEMGVQAGVSKSGVSLSALREKLEWRLPQIQWAHARWDGVALVVRLERGASPPPDDSGDGRMDVVAESDGCIRRLTAYAGTPLVKPGDMVKAGQVLIRGEEKGKDGAAVPVRARGEALASVWYAVRVRVPLTYLRSSPTGRFASRRVIASPFYSLSFTDTPDYLTCDVEKTALPLGGAWAPIWLEKETYAEAALEKTSRDQEEARREAESAALRAVEEALIDDEIVDKWINFSMIEGDSMIAEAVGEAIRDIGRRQAVSSP